MTLTLLFYSTTSELSQKKIKSPKKTNTSSYNVAVKKHNPDPTVLRLYATNKEVDEYNKKRMTAFTSTITLVAHDTTTTMKGKTRIEQAPIQFHASEGCMLPETLTVAVDSRIMVIANVDVTGKNSNMLFTKFQHTH